MINYKKTNTINKNIIKYSSTREINRFETISLQYIEWVLKDVDYIECVPVFKITHIIEMYNGESKENSRGIARIRSFYLILKE